MRVLIIGGTKFIGPHVVSSLDCMGHELAVFHRGQHETSLPTGVRRILGNRRDLRDFSDEFKRFAPHVVLDMIPFSEKDAQNLMTTFKGIAQRIVAVSSQDVYRAWGVYLRTESGPLEPIPLTEEAPLRNRLYPYRGEIPRGPKDRNQWLDDYEKILVEKTIMGDPDLPGTILRLPAVYGPGSYSFFHYVKRMDDKRPAILLGEGLAQWRWTRGYVENVAAAVTKAVADKRAIGRTYNIGEMDALSEVELVKEIGQVAGWQGQIVVVPKHRLPEHMVKPTNTDQHIVADTTRIRKDLDYRESMSRYEGLMRTIEWQREHSSTTKIDPNQFDYASEDMILADLKQHGS